MFEVIMSVVVFKMEKEESRVVIKHFYFKKWTATQIQAELDEVHGNFVSALKTIYL